MAKILIVDDDTHVRYTITKALKTQGHDVVEAGNGRIALDVLGHAPVDLVITDIIMPEMEGIGTILELRKRYPAMKIIAISGGGRSRSVDFLSTARQFGAAATLEKPFAIDDLTKAVNKCLDGCMEGRTVTGPAVRRADRGL